MAASLALLSVILSPPPTPQKKTPKQAAVFEFAFYLEIDLPFIANCGFTLREKV